MFHTSPAKITKHSNGLFGEFICFSDKVYRMNFEAKHVYTFDNEVSLIEACSIAYHEDYAKIEHIVSEVAESFEIDEEDALDLISEKKTLFDFADCAESEDLFYVQHMTAKCAKLLGFDGCIMNDEQGTVYFVDVFKINLKLLEE